MLPKDPRQTSARVTMGCQFEASVKKVAINAERLLRHRFGAESLQHAGLPGRG
jgi:hypothetical protein